MRRGVLVRAPPRAEFNETATGLMHRAVDQNELEAMKEQILVYGADINAGFRANNGWPPIMQATLDNR